MTASITITDYKKVYQEFVESTRIDTSSLEESNFNIEKFLSPYLVIDEIKQDGKVTLRNVEIHFSLSSLFTFNPQITSLEIGEAIIYLTHDDVDLLSHDEFISELIAKKALSVEAKIDKLTFIESDAGIPLVIEDFIFAGKDGLTEFSGSVDYLGTLNGSFVKSGDEVLFTLKIQDKTYTFDLEEKYKNNDLEQGKAIIKTSNLSRKFAKVLPNLNEITDRLDSAEEVNITLDIKPIKNWISFRNIVIDSESLQGKGEVNLSKNSKDLSEVKLDFSKIDLMSWRKSIEETEEPRRAKYSTNEKFDFNKNRMKANIYVKDMKLDKDNSLSDLNIKAEIENGKLFIRDFSGNIDQSGKFSLEGTISQNSFRSLFNGKITLNHKDLNDLAEYFGGKEIRSNKMLPFYASADIKLSSVDLSLQNVLVKTFDTEIIGNLSTKFIGNSPRTNANIKFSSVDIDKGSLPALTQGFDYVVSLTNGMKEEGYLSKFIPIRKIGSISNFEITFDRLVYNKNLYDDVNFNLELSPGRVSLEQLYLKDGNDWIDTSLTLEAQGIRPTLKAVIHGGSIAVDFLSAPSMLTLRKKILNNLDLSKIDIVMDFSLKKIYQDNFSLGRVKFNANNDKNLLNISKLDADLFGGRMQSSGSALLEPYTLNFVYALNSAQVKEIAKLLPKGMLSSGGLFSSSGMWSTNGDKLNEQLYNLYTKSNVVTKDITLSSLSIDNLIQEMGVANYDVTAFQSDLKKALLTGETEISDLKTSVQLSKGIFKLPSITFKTKYSAGSGAATFNIYDFNIDSSAIFSFYLAKQKHGRSVVNYAPSKMTVTAKGNLFSPKKESDTKELETILMDRSKQ